MVSLDGRVGLSLARVLCLSNIIITNGAMQSKLQCAGKVCSSLEEVVGLVKGFVKAAVL
jgi:hypothetical protein